jgi:hypothetical protein
MFQAAFVVVKAVIVAQSATAGFEFGVLMYT